MIRPRLLFLYVVIAGVLLAAAFSSFYLLNPDGVSYISLAQHWADGHWKAAINGYWSPILSWLLVPFIKVGIDPQAAARLILVGVALACLAVGDRLVRQYASAKGKMAALVIYYLAMVPFLARAVHGLINPDLLVVLFVLLLAAVLSRTTRLKDRSKRTLVCIGILGGIGFMAKAFLSPFFVATVVVWYLLFGEGGLTATFTERLKRLGVVLVAFLITILPWVTLLSLKYEHITTGNSGEYSLAYIGPESEGLSILKGLLPPPNEFAYSPWEDNAWHPYKKWSPLQSVDDFRYYVQYVVTKNVPAVNAVLNELSPYLVFVFLTLVVLLVADKVSRRQREFLTLAVIAGVVYALGYYAIHVSGGSRYLWPVLVLSILVVSVLGGTWYAQSKKRSQKILAIILIATFLWPNYYSFCTYDKQRNYAYAQSLYQAGQFVKKRTKPRDRIASNHSWASTQIAYYANLSGYGTTTSSKSLTSPGIQNALRDYRIKWFFYVDLHRTKEDLAGFNIVGKTNVHIRGKLYRAYLIKL